jgi:hypothetical protein
MTKAHRGFHDTVTNRVATGKAPAHRTKSRCTPKRAWFGECGWKQGCLDCSVSCVRSKL